MKTVKHRCRMCKQPSAEARGHGGCLTRYQRRLRRQVVQAKEQVAEATNESPAQTVEPIVVRGRDVRSGEPQV